MFSFYFQVVLASCKYGLRIVEFEFFEIHMQLELL